MFPDVLRLCEQEFYRVDANLFQACYEGGTRLWSAHIQITDSMFFARAWRRVGRGSLLFLDQLRHLVDDSCSDPWFHLELEMARFVRSLDRKAIEAAKRESVVDSALEATHPALHEYLTLTAVGKEPRETSRLSVFTEDGCWKCFLNDPHTGRYVCVSAKSLQGVLDALEKALAAGEADWRQSRGVSKKSR